MADSKFIVGAKVYKRLGYSGDWVEDYVDRVHKNGNFVLLGESGQWRPYNNASACKACKAGKRDRWSRHRLRLADEEMEAEVKAGRAEKARHNRRQMLDTAPDLPPMPDHIFSTIAKYCRLMEQIRNATGDVTITASQAIMIMALGNDKVNAGNIISSGYYFGTNPTYNINMLHGKGFIERSDVNGDRRQRLVSLTPKGLKLCVQLRNALAPVAPVGRVLAAKDVTEP